MAGNQRSVLPIIPENHKIGRIRGGGAFRDRCEWPQIILSKAHSMEVWLE